MSDVLCAGCGSTQRAGAPFCAVCGREFPRTGRPVETPAGQPQGALQRAHTGGGVAGAPDAVSLVHTGTTEPEMMTATQVPAYQRPAPPEPKEVVVYAHVGRRLVAFLLDGVVAGVIFGIVYGIGFATIDLPSGLVTSSDPRFASLVSQILTVVGIASALAGLYWLGMLVWEGRTGRTVGNLVMGIRTQREADGMPIGVGRALLRYLVVAACGLVPVFGTLLVLLSPLWDGSGRKQGWHDKAAKAVVVDQRAMQRAATPRTASFAPATGGPSAGPDLPAPAGPPQAGPPPAAVAPQQDAAPQQPAAPQRPVVQPVPQQPVAPQPATPQPATPQPAAPQPATPQPAAPQPGTAPAGVHDPYAAPAYQPSSGVGAEGLITGVPGAGAPPAQPAAPQPQQPPAPQPAPPQPTPQPAPPQPTPQPAPPQQPAAPQPQAPESEVPEHTSFETRMQSRAQRQELRPAPVSAVELELESGDRHVVGGPARVGRNPEASSGESLVLVRVDDPTRSVSKNHADLDVDSAGLWLTDRGSTNGTVISVPGLPPRVAEPGARVRVPVGATIHVGDRRIVVHPGRRA